MHGGAGGTVGQPESAAAHCGCQRRLALRAWRRWRGRCAPGRPWQPGHSTASRYTAPAAVKKPTEDSTRERDLGVGVGRDSRYGSIYVCPPTPPETPRRGARPLPLLPLPQSSDPRIVLKSRSREREQVPDTQLGTPPC